jgi:hypothetical protein
VSVFIVAQPSSEVPQGLTNYPIYIYIYIYIAVCDTKKIVVLPGYELLFFQLEFYLIHTFERGGTQTCM